MNGTPSKPLSKGDHVSIEKKADGVYKVRWWEDGRQKRLIVHGSFDLAKKIQRKKLSARDENRHPGNAEHRFSTPIIIPIRS
jgi:hypothetical protein